MRDDARFRSGTAAELSPASPRVLRSVDRCVEPLRIAMLAPPWIPVPPRGYGGIEAVVDLLCEALVQRGHEVTLFAAPGSRSAARVYPLLEDAHPDEIGSSLYESDHVACAWEQIDLAAARGVPFDVRARPLRVHRAGDGRSRRRRRSCTRSTARSSATRRRSTGATGTRRGWWRSAARRPRAPRPACGSRASCPTRSWSSAGRCATRRSDYVLWIGRMDPVKGAHRAIAAARLAGRTLVLAGPVQTGQERLLPRADRAARRRPAGALRRRGRRERQAAAVRERGGAADADPLARAVRDGDGRGARVRHAGDRVPRGRRGRDRDRRRERDARAPTRPRWPSDRPGRLDRSDALPRERRPSATTYRSAGRLRAGLPPRCRGGAPGLDAANTSDGPPARGPVADRPPNSLRCVLEPLTGTPARSS